MQNNYFCADDMDWLEKLDRSHLPQHVAIIMDGNGRWAKQQGKPRVFGHKNGVRSVREITEAATELGIPYLTLYAFSTENWKRPSLEVSALMNLLVETIGLEMKTLMENNVRLHTIGDISHLPSRTYQALLEAKERTKQNSRLNLVLALNYSSRHEIVEAAKHLAQLAAQGKLAADQIDEALFSEHLFTSAMPDPDLLIRTSGEQRISNFLCYQIAYAELYFTPVLWPDFRKQHFYQALVEYQLRERRFGLTSEQVR